MKKIFTMIMTFAALGMTACGTNTGSETENAGAEQESADVKTAVVYFSATGTTKAVAEKIADKTKGTLIEITPEKAYTEADLDWKNKQSRSSVEMQDLSSRPAISNKPVDMGQYDVVYIGYPIWWYTAPTIVNTFIEANKMEGVTIIPFATSGGSTIDKSVEDLRKAYSTLKIADGKLLNNPSDADIAELYAYSLTQK